MTVITMPDGVDVEFPDDMPRERISAIIRGKFPDAVAAAARDDHGLARRRAMSPIEKAVSPITEYPRNYSEMNREAREQIDRGGGQIAGAWRKADGVPQQALWEAAKGSANVGLGALGYLFSPVGAGYRSIAGQPLEDVTGIPREYTEFATQLATPGIGLTRLPGKPGAAPQVEFKPPEVSEAGPAAPGPAAPGPAAPGPGLVAAQDRLREAGYPMDVPRSITSDSAQVQRAGEHLSNIPFVGDPLKQAFHERVPGQMVAARDAIASEFGAGTGPNVAHRAGNTLAEAATAETRAATEAARASDEAALAAHQRTQQEALRGIGQTEAQSLEQTRAAVGDMSPQDMGEALIARLRAGEQEARATKNRLYAEAGQSDATIDVNAVRNIRNHINEAVNKDGVVIDPGVDGVSQTPAARSMLNALDRYAELKAPDNMVAPAGPGGKPVALSVGGIDQMRKHLSGIARTSTNSTDRRAASSIMRAFEGWETNAFDNALFSGSPEGLATLRQARAANRDLMERFGYNAESGAEGAADRILHRIATGEVTPQEVSNWLVGASQVGAKGSSTQLLRRITEATGGDPEAMQAIRGGIWNRLSQATEGATGKSPEKIASGINEFLNGSGRALARELYTPEQQDVMRAYANTLRRGQAARETVAETAANTLPGATRVEKGPLQQLADRVIGKGQKHDEALFETLYGYAQKGGDVKTLARLVHELPQGMKGDLAGSFVRQLGVNRAGTFSADQFVTQWNNMTPQAKAVMFGNAGEHVTALNDIALIAQRMKDVRGRYGNPSGTAQNAVFASLLGLLGGTVSLPAAIGTAAVSGAGNIASRVLASPAGASMLAKHAKAVERAAGNPTPQNQAMVSATERRLTDTIKTLGAAHGAQDEKQ